jgi:hypothetical protein
MTGTVLAIADKLETLVGIWGVGLAPTGDKDPYALRRHALGICRLLLEKNLPCSLPELIELARGQFKQAGVQEKVAQLSGGLAQAELSGEYGLRAAQVNKEAGATADRQIAALAAQIREKDSTLSPAEVNARATKEYLNLSGRYPGADRMALEQDKMRTKRLDDATEAWGDASMDPAFRKKFNDLKKADSDRADAFKKAWIADHMAMADAKPAQGAPTQGAPTPTPAPVRGAPATQGASLPQAALSQLKEGQQTKFANEQVWTLQNGQPVRVK